MECELFMKWERIIRKWKVRAAVVTGHPGFSV